MSTGTAGTYRTFIRSSTNWKEFGSNRKTTQERGLSWEEARDKCQAYAVTRTTRQRRKGTMLEFERE